MQFRLPFTFGLMVVLVAANAVVHAQTSLDPSNAIRAAMESGNWKAARVEIEKLRSTDASSFRSKNYDYLLARIAEETADSPTATQNYQAAINNNSPLAQYALWHLARMTRATGDLVLEREHLRKLISIAPNSLLYEAASLRLARSFFESGDFAAATNAARTVSSAKTISIAREGSLILAQSYLKEGKYPEARDALNKLVMQMPDASRPDDFALAAVRVLDELRTQTDIPAAPLTEADHLLRASVYQFNRDFAGARFHYQAIVNANPQSGAVPNATYQLGRGLYLEGKYDEAIKLFQRVADQFPQSQSARDALPSLAASYLRLKRVDDAVNAYQLFINRFPEAPNPERPYLNIIDALHEAGRHPEALNWIQRARARFKSDLGGSLVLFAQLRIHLAQSAWTAAIRDADELLKLSDLGGTRVGGGTTPAEVAFLRAFSLEQLGGTEEAISAYLAISDGRNEYYGNRASQRLVLMGANEKTRNAIATRFNGLYAAAKAADAQSQVEPAKVAAQSAIRLSDSSAKRAELLAILRRSYAALPSYKLPELHIVALSSSNPQAAAESSHQMLADILIGLGLFDEAMPEVFAARSSAKPGANSAPTAVFSDEGYTLAFYSLRGGIPNRTVRFGELLWKPVPADYVLEAAPQGLVELLYPAPFRDSLLKHATPRNVDPRFVLSIIRQESRYQVDVKSVSAARGMMQFIASTANEIAVQLKLNGFTQDDLYSPDTAILFGSQYLANLFQQFPNQPQAVAGSYNGGADNLARWIARSQANEADRYVPEIGFSQTKDYVYKVMTNYWNYQSLYNNELQAQTK